MWEEARLASHHMRGIFMVVPEDQAPPLAGLVFGAVAVEADIARARRAHLLLEALVARGVQQVQQGVARNPAVAVAYWLGCVER